MAEIVFDKTKVVGNSSSISLLRYSVKSKMLEVTFKNNSVYHYHLVPENVFRLLSNAPSAGTFLHAHIKGVYRDQRIS